jgi:hypothetical protein
MKGRLTFYLVLTGTGMFLIGVITAVALVIHRANCDGASPAVVCQGYTNSLHWAYLAFSFGIICFIAAGLSTLFAAGPSPEGPPRQSPRHGGSKGHL